MLQRWHRIWPALVLFSGVAVAEVRAEEHPLRLHGGLNLRTDMGVHPLRLDGGVRYGMVDGVLVLDPLLFLDGQTSTDLLLQWRSPWSVGLFGGWRLSTIPLTQGPQLQHNLLLGATADLPRWFGGLLSGQVGFELASVLLKHGGGLPQETIAFKSGRHFVDLVNAALFLRIELGYEP